MVTLKTHLRRTAGVVAAFAMAASPVLVSAASNTATTSVEATVGSTISVSSSGTVAIGLTPGGSAVVSSSSDTVSVSTNNSAGYTLTLADSDAVTNLVSGTDTITPSAGTQAAPVTLATGKWGYAVPTVGGFDASYSTETNSTSSTSKWAGVPASGSPNTLKTTATTASADTTTVWYGAKVDSTQPTGTYIDTVTYTATTN
ncbi:MAG TPA: hypothetical protein VL362_00665 [Patescibacteria group bacterium]|jgi:hypothetical protein|nr:hypothetical protein [Patescibacteria group bacterium]